MTVDLIYIAGFGRSGSTLLEAQMQGRFDVLGVGEAFFLWDRGVLKNEILGDGRPFASSPFWQTVLRAGFGGIDPDRARICRDTVERLRGERPRPGPIETHLPGDLGPTKDALAPLYCALKAEAGGRVLVDSSKYPLYAAALDAVLPFRIGVIHLFRDPCAVTHAWMQRKPRPEAGPGAMMARSRTPLGPAWRWLWLNRQAEALETELGLPRVLISYDRFCADPAPYLSLIAARFGLGRATRLRTAWPSVSGNPDRLTGRLDRIRQDIRWQAQMGSLPRGIASTLCGRYHARLLADEAAQFRAAA